MLKALDENKNNIYPKKGGIGFCPNCGAVVKAYCGEIYTHHWRHLESQHCDDWGEAESDWHRAWKNNFPFDWQEVIIKENGEQHIADVRNSLGIVLELQNSSISSETIRIRERFYGYMIWLINANDFSDNFQIYSEVKAQLRYIESSYSYEEERLIGEVEQDGKVMGQKEKLAEKEWKLTKEESKSKRIGAIIEDLEQRKGNLDDSLNSLMESKFYIWNSHIEYKPKYKRNLEENDSKLKKLEEQRDGIIVKLEKLNSLKACTLRGFEQYKYINSSKLEPHYYQDCCLLDKSSDKSLFPEVIYFKSEWDFKQSANNPKCHLLLNPSSLIESLNKEMGGVESEMKDIKEANQNLMDQMKSDYFNYLQQQLELKKNEIKSIEASINSIKSDIGNLVVKVEQAKEEARIRNSNSIKALAKRKEKDQWNVKKKYKGLYGYHWKYRRKSWDYASAPIFLDFGQHIFKVVDENTLRKLSIEEFIATYKSGLHQGLSIFDAC